MNEIGVDKIEPNKIEKDFHKAREQLVKTYLLKSFAVQTVPLSEFMDTLEKDLISYALLISEENQKKAAFLLGLKVTTMCEKMKKHNISMNKSGRYPTLLKSLTEISNLLSKSS
jgi:DNA-binding NtrC family response regulator